MMYQFQINVFVESKLREPIIANHWRLSTFIFHLKIKKDWSIKSYYPLYIILTAKKMIKNLALLLLTIFVLCVYKFIKSIECRLSLAIDIVPPIANEVLLIEHGSIWTKKTVSIPVWLAHVENLSKCIKWFLSMFA